MLCARLMRGISSMANSETPDFASASRPSASENGSSMPISAAPFFIALDEVRARPPHREHDIGARDRLLVGLGDLGAGRLVVIVGEMRPEPRARAQRDARARLDELLDRLGRQPDARLVLTFRGHANRDHQGSKAQAMRRARRLAPVRIDVEG